MGDIDTGGGGWIGGAEVGDKGDRNESDGVVRMNDVRIGRGEICVCVLCGYVHIDNFI